MVTSNLERLAEEWSGAAELSVYLADEIGGTDRAAIERDLNGDASVASVEFVTKAAAMKRFQDTFPDLAQTLGAMEENPLPASLDVRLRSSAAAQTAVQNLVERMRGTAGVTDVRYDQDWLDRLSRGRAPAAAGRLRSGRCADRGRGADHRQRGAPRPQRAAR